VSEKKTIYGGDSQLHTSTTGNVDELRVVHINVEGWIGLGLLVLFFLSSHYIRRFFRVSALGLLYFHVAQKQFKENSLLIAYVRRILLIFSMTSISFFILLIVRYHVFLPNHLTAGQFYLVILAGLLVFYILKSILLRIIGLLAQAELPMRLMAYYGQLYVIAGGIFLFPIIILFFNESIMWCNILIIIGISISGLLVLFYLIRTLQIFVSSRISLFFWILYLCTFEIAPFLFIYKYISLI
jgi:hypothetical protein